MTGALGLLARAKTLGLISELRPLVEKMLRSGRWYDPTSSGVFSKEWESDVAEDRQLTTL